MTPSRAHDENGVKIAITIAATIVTTTAITATATIVVAFIRDDATTRRGTICVAMKATTMVAVAVITVVVTIVAAIVIAILTTFSSCARDGVMYAPSR